MGSVASEMRTLFTNEAGRAALANTLLYSDLPADKTPVPSILGLTALLCDGFYLPKGGMVKIPEALKELFTICLQWRARRRNLLT